MNINLTILKEKNVCKEDLEWFEANFGDNDVDVYKVVDLIHEQKNVENGSTWVFTTFKLTGIAKTFHKNGQVAIECNCKDGKKHGIEKWFYDNGQLAYEANWKDGKSHDI